MTTSSVSPRVSPEHLTHDELDAQLERFETSRQEHLDSLPSHDLDVVAAAHRASVERILDEVRTARQRLAAGRYGTCMSCADPISVGRLELRPWATRCTRCTEQPRW